MPEQPDYGIDSPEVDRIKAMLASSQTSSVAPSQPLPDTEESNQGLENVAPTPRSPADILAKLQSLKTSPTKNAPPVQDVLSRLLGQSREDLSEAKQQRNQLQLLANLGQAGSTVGQALTPLAPKQDASNFWNTLREQAQQPVSDLKTQQALSQGVLQGQKLQADTSTEMSQSDPTSAVSKIMRDLYKQETGRTADESLAYADLEKLAPSLSRLAAAKQNLENRKMLLSAKGDEKQNTAIKDVQNMIESSRGARDVQSAKETTRLINNAQSLLAEYPDLNQMPKAQVALFAQELAKIAKGGVAGEAEVREIMPHSVASQIMSGLSTLQGDPNGAQLGEFLKTYQPYLETIKKNSEKLAYDRTDRILKAQAGRLGKANSELLRSIYPETALGEAHAPVAPQKSANVSIPKEGMIEEHEGVKYKFKGGNPADPAAWEKQ